MRATNDAEAVREVETLVFRHGAPAEAAFLLLLHAQFLRLPRIVPRPRDPARRRHCQNAEQRGDDANGYEVETTGHFLRAFRGSFGGAYSGSLAFRGVCAANFRATAGACENR